MLHRLNIALLTAWGLLASLAMAQEVTGSPDPHALVASATLDVMAVVAGADEYVEEDPDRYYQQIQGILDPLIDYRGFARKVMGPYASSQRYRSLDEAGRDILREQLNQFTEVMRLSLVRTYSKGLLIFGDARIEIEPLGSEETLDKSTSVRQRIYTEDDEPYIVLYQMGKSKSGDWQLRNVIIESVNLGEIYRDQFLASARELDGDLNGVIQNWTTVSVEVEE